MFQENTEEKRYAVMYTRMSTDNQKYSIDNQKAAIEEYALKNNIEIVKEYSDAGKSGLNINNRKGLQSLINEVTSGRAQFSIILVLDITRWGRFQDADESAYYEYICRQKGINVQYVGEGFKNDGNPVDTIVKGVKRAMAGEYSRELSNKVFKGQCNLVKKGYRLGGIAGFGLRRMLVSEDGRRKGILKLGEKKSIQTDRIILVPGPLEEVSIVRWIYDAYVKENLNMSSIAEILNNKGILNHVGSSWKVNTITQILSNEKYIGNSVFNKTSSKLRTSLIHNHPDSWVRCEGAFEPIVNKEIFYKAKQKLKKGKKRCSDSEMLNKLVDLYKRNNKVSVRLINDDKSIPSSSSYAKRFGSVFNACAQINVVLDEPQYIIIQRFLSQYIYKVTERVIKKLVSSNIGIQITAKENIFIISGEVRVLFIASRCYENIRSRMLWKFKAKACIDLIVVIRMSRCNKVPLDYYVFPAIDISTESKDISLKESNPFHIEVYKVDSLDKLISIAKRRNIMELI